MSLSNQNGFIKSSVGLSVTIHAVIIGLLIFAPQVKQLPLIKDMISSRTSTDMGIESSLGAKEQISVSYVEPEKNNIKAINSVKDNIEVQKNSPTKVDQNNIPYVPEKKIGKSKVKKLLAKNTIAPVKVNDTDITEYKNEIEKPLAKLENDSVDEVEDQDIESNENLVSKNNEIPTEQASSENDEPKLIKNPNPPAVIDHTKDLLAGNSQGSGGQDARKLKQLAGNPKPAYPNEARLAKTQGTVILKYLVTDKGTVKDIKVLESSGSSELDKEAVNKIQRWRFQPGQAGETTHPVTFKLNGPSKRLPSKLRTSKNG